MWPSRVRGAESHRPRQGGGPSGAGLRTGRRWSGQESAPHGRLAGSPQFPAAWASPSWRLASAKLATKRAVRKVREREILREQASNRERPPASRVTVFWELVSGVTSLVLAGSWSRPLARGGGGGTQGLTSRRRGSLRTKSKAASTHHAKHPAQRPVLPAFQGSKGPRSCFPVQISKGGLRRASDLPKVTQLMVVELNSNSTQSQV